MPFADTSAMNAHLAANARTVAPRAHAVVILDGAGWHDGHDLVVPENMSPLLPPPYSPELNPVGKGSSRTPDTCGAGIGPHRRG